VNEKFVAFAVALEAQLHGIGEFWAAKLGQFPNFEPCKQRWFLCWWPQRHFGWDGNCICRFVQRRTMMDVTRVTRAIKQKIPQKRDFLFSLKY
jgi:hypothetical protein